MSEDRNVEDDLRRLKVRVRKKVKGLWRSSDKSEPPTVDNEAPSEQTTPDSQHLATENLQEEQPERTTESVTPALTPHKEDALLAGPEGIDTAGWDKIWVDAYKRVKEDPRDANLLTNFELFLESRGQIIDPANENDSSVTTGSFARLKTIQKIAEEQLTKFEEGKLSFNVGSRPIVVRESIVKAVDVINAFKPLVSGTVAAEPAAALAWAGITTALPILEGICKQDENAATGLTEIIFLMARYQTFHGPDFASHLRSTSDSVASRELLQHVKTELVSIYAAIYLYEARFILQYATRNKVHRALRNALNADEWRSLWSEIQSKSRRIDDGVRDQIGLKTLKPWNEIDSIGIRTGRIESVQQDTLKAVMNIDRRQLLQSLKITGNAIFDSRETSSMEAPCLPGTQLRMLKTIQDWAEDHDGTMIFWLQGMAGTGETSISMTVASALKEGRPFTNRLDPPIKVFLGASFFFNHGDATRNSTVEFFTTIAWCLSGILSDDGSPVIQAIRDNPGIETKSPQEQFRKLIADPLALIDKHTFVPFQLLIVIDALDECDYRDAESLLGMLQVLENLCQVRLRLFITSRRERHIDMGFKRLPGHLYQTMKLEKVESTVDGDNDITLYLSTTLQDMSAKYGVEDGGVSKADIKKLAEKADGLFIYAVTACRFLDGFHFCDKELRDEGLSLIFQEQDGPQQEVDGIYLNVLQFPYFRTSSKRLKELFHAEISRLIGFFVVLLRPVSVDTLCALLPMESTRLNSYLGHLHPILNVPNDATVPATLIHLSFRDFILDNERSELLPFSIKELEMHQDILCRCLAVMNSGLCHNICCLDLPGTFVSEVDPSHIEDHIPQYLRYACRHWVSHLSRLVPERLVQVGLQDGGAIHLFLQEKLLFWLEAMAFIEEAPAIIPMVSQLESIIKLSGNSDLESLMYDASRFIRSNRWIIEHVPLQMYCSGLLFFPSESRIRLHYQHLIPEWITTQPKTSETSSSELCTLHGHTGSILDAKFSPTEPLLASTSSDNTTRVWNYFTGSEQYRFQCPGKPLYVSFSMDGSKLAYGCFDGTVCVRDLRNATDVSFSYPSKVVEVSFSPTATNILAALCDDGLLRIWNLEDKQQNPIQHACDPYPQGFFFSPDGRSIAVKSRLAISLFDVQIAKLARQFEARGTPTTLAFSIDSVILAVRHFKSIDFWDIASSEPSLIDSYEEPTWLTYTFLHLPVDKRFYLEQGSFGTVELCQPSSGASIGKFHKGFGGRWSHDGALIADISSPHPVIRVLSTRSASLVRDFENNAPYDVQFSLDDGVVLSCHPDSSTKRWNLVDGSMQPLQDNVMTATFSPKGQFLLLRLGKGQEFQVWNQTLNYIHATFEEMAHIAFVPGSDHLTTLSLRGEFQILEWDVETCSFKLIDGFILEGFNQFPKIDDWSPSAFYLSPSGHRAVVNVNGQRYNDPVSCQLWDLKTKKKLNATLLNWIYDVSFSSTNNFFFVRYESGRQTRLYHLSSGEEVKDCDLRGYTHPKLHPVRDVFAVESEDEETVAIWEGPSWIQRIKLKAPDGKKVGDCTFSATSKFAALFKSEEAHSSTIEIWDITMGQRIGSHTVGLTGWVFSFSFSPDENILHSNRGNIPVPIQDTAKQAADKHWKYIRDCLYVLDEWVFQGHERLIWLPSAYRPQTTGDQNIAVRGGKIALGNETGSVVFIEVSLEETPVAKRYMLYNQGTV